MRGADLIVVLGAHDLAPVLFITLLLAMAY
jgi:hypothetical protein